MASILLHADRLEIKLTAAEKMLARRKDDVVIPRESIRSVSLTDDPWIWIRGVRAPGTAFPLTLAVGQWKFHGGKDFVLLKGSRPAVVIDLIDEEFRRVLVSTRKGLELIAALRLEERKPRKVRVHMAQPRTKAVASVTTLPTAKKPAAKKPAAKKPAATMTSPAAPTAAEKTAPKKAAPKKAAPKKPAAPKSAPGSTVAAAPSAQAPATAKAAPKKPAAKKPATTSAAKKPGAKKPAGDKPAPKKPAQKPDETETGSPGQES
ncbi:hypothetical protein SAMN04489806_0874 [Paramicrobacterium humi]|uniref:Uncharacterized protein n=1 Tax=Paramicrobacterium humi TaxID=640635 RepID=A0A1H4JW07_9MICO|nr:hypothetical protein [Microbacterium humi]SEB50025.1 hypothetical protein SAMN04489806_0874 [Microbacterium humi]